MIGIKVKNSFWEKVLLDLLEQRAEIWHPQKFYHAIITDVAPIEKSVSIGLGRKDCSYSLCLPFKKNQLDTILAQIPYPYENDIFVWNSSHHQLQNKKTKDKIQLTEKEALVIDFLSHCPQKEASKAELLQNVWQYKKGTNTHTVETTIHTLRQKLGPHAHDLIVSTKTGYRLV